MINTAKHFWLTRKEYPPVVCNLKRRCFDLNFILQYTDGAKSFMDIGCGEGHLPLLLRELTEIDVYYAYDLSALFINNLIRKWGDYKNLIAEPADFGTLADLPSVDLCVCMGVALYILDDEELRNVISKIDSKLFICRVPCSLGQHKIEIDKFSAEYRSNYAAVYRTIAEYISILSEFFNIDSIDRCYPDEIESKYGTKQFNFVCKARV